MAEEYVLVYNQVGYPLAELEPSSVRRAWELNGVGRGELVLPLSDRKLNSDIIAYGNLIAVVSDEVPLWGGVIMPPTKIDATTASFSMYSGERLLKNRTIPHLSSLRGSPGAAFRSVISLVQRWYQPNLIYGDITETIDKMDLVTHWMDASSIVDEIADRSKQDFQIQPDIVRGKLLFKANWFPRRGVDRSKQVRLSEGHNITAAFQLEEAGDLVDSVTVLGSGDDIWKRPSVLVNIGENAGQYGKWNKAIEANRVTELDELQNIGAQYLKDNAYLTFRLMLEVVNEGDVFMQFDVGDIVTVELVSFNYSPSYVLPLRSRARVLARAYDIVDGTMPIVVESYLVDRYEERVGK